MALILKNTTFHYDFFHKGKRYQGSTGESDRLAAQLVVDEVKRNLGKLNWVRTESAEPGIYFIKSKATGLVKVGCSGNLTIRINSLIESSHDELILMAKIPAIDYKKAESNIHEFLRPFHYKLEWFRGITGRHIEAALGYWITGHPAFGGNKKINGQIEPDESLDEPVEPSPVLPTYLQGLDSDEASRR